MPNRYGGWTAGREHRRVSGSAVSRSCCSPRSRGPAGIFPGLEAALGSAAPTGVDLTTSQAYELLTEYRPLLEESGFIMEVPAWWDDPASWLGARLQVHAPDLTEAPRFERNRIVRAQPPRSAKPRALPVEDLRRRSAPQPGRVRTTHPAGSAADASARPLGATPAGSDRSGAAVLARESRRRDHAARGDPARARTGSAAAEAPHVRDGR